MTTAAGSATSGEPSSPPDAAPGSEVFGSFYEREVAGQIRRAALLLGSREAAHDVVHDAFVALYQRWDQITEPRPYLERSVLNGCRDAARRERTRASAPSVPLPGDLPAIDAPLHDALAKLPFNHRAVVVLRFYLQLTEAEIAERLGCRPGSVGPWIQRALRRLRKELS